MRKGHKLSAETRAKMSAAHRGKTFTQEHRDRIAAAKTGQLNTPETRAKISAALTGKKRGPLSPEHRARIGAAAVGNRYGSFIKTAETRAKLSASLKGRKRPPEVCAKMSIANLGKVRSMEARAKTSASVRRAFAEGRIAPTCYTSLAQTLHRYLVDRCGIVGLEIEVPFGPYRVDLYDPHTRTAFEADGVYWHDRVEAKKPGYHARRDAYLRESHGLTVVRVSDHELGHLMKRLAA